MIKCNKGMIHIEGSMIQIKAEFATLVRELKGHISKEELTQAFEDGFNDRDDLVKEMRDSIPTEVLEDIIRKIISETEGK